MEIKAGSAAIAILVKMRLLGVIQTLVQHQTQYGSPASIAYDLIIESTDKTTHDTSIAYIPGLSTSDGIYFTLPASLFVTEQITLRCSLRFTYDAIIDSAKQNFEIKVTKATSTNTK